MTNTQDVSIDDVQALLDQAGLSSGSPPQISSSEAGGNNLIFQVNAADQIFALKKYKIDDGDVRDRLGTEWAFLTALKSAELPIPKAFAVDHDKGLALYSFVDGHKLKEENIAKEHIEQASGFIKNLNAHQVRSEARSLESASEAAFCVQGHFDILDGRIARLKTFEGLDELLNDLEAARTKLHNHLCAEINIHTELKTEERLLSPSDFGFHNALADDAGQLTFIDFEYAGWDDPAKLSSDFFFQPQIPVNEQFYDDFLEACLNHIAPESLDFQRKRAILLRPLFGLRWCCIVLNPFDPSWAEKQDQAISEDTLEKLRLSRFNTAKSLLDATKILIERL